MVKMISYDRLQKARVSKSKPFQTDSAWFKSTHSSQLPRQDNERETGPQSAKMKGR